MQKKRNKILRSCISVFLSIIICMLSLPMAYAVENIQLTIDNVIEWPRFEGEMFYGQTLAEGSLKLVGGKVTLDGTAEGVVVDGCFEFVDTTIRPKNGDVAQLKFVPNDTENYTGFEAIESELTVPVSKTTPIYTALPVPAKAAAVKRRLSTVKLTTTEKLINPYTNEIIADSKWNWKKMTQQVTAPGLYEVQSTCGASENAYYNLITAFVWVSIEGVEDSLFPTIIENPTFTETVRLNPNKTWGDYTLTGGKAVVKDTDGNEIEAKGSFVVNDNYKDVATDKIGSRLVGVDFISADETIASSVPLMISFTVEKALPAWKDGEIPTVLLNVGNALNTKTTTARLLPFINADGDFTVIPCNDEGESLEGTVLPVGTHKLKAKILPKESNTNWDSALLDFYYNIVARKATFEDISYNYITGALAGKVNSFDLKGTVDVYVNDELAAKGLSLNKTYFATNWEPADKSQNAVYTLKLIYNAPEGVEENAYINEPFETEITYKAKRTITVKHEQITLRVNNTSYSPNNTFSGDRVYLDTVPGFLYWEITDVNGNSVLDKLEVIKNSTNDSYFEFKMPEYDIIINAVHEFDLNPPEEEKPDDGDNGGGILDGIGDIDSIEEAGNFFAKIIAWLKGIIEKIIDFFQNIGDIS